MKKTKIHFVCKGNIFRSRLAEAYAKSIGGDKYDVSSSGTVAAKYPPDFLSPWTTKIAGECGLTEWLSKAREQTTEDKLQDADIVVFLNKNVYEDAKALYEFSDSKTLVWRVRDWDEWKFKIPDSQKLKRSFKSIKSNVSILLKNIEAGGWVDIVDENNEPLGFSLPVTIANQKGLWHRGCHAIVTTPDHKILVEKRSSTIIFSPNLIDISLGGHVDSGEEPGHAMLREVQEEVGLRLAKEQLNFLEIHKRSSYHPKYKLHTKSFVYTFHIKLHEINPLLTIQRSEVKTFKFLTYNQVRRLLKTHRVAGLGRLSYAYNFYRQLIKRALNISV
jgi:isopentenyl-diphosphate Delta-isomerase